MNMQMRIIMMNKLIEPIDITNLQQAEIVLSIQLVSYQVEAELIGFDDLPPLHDTAESLCSCGEQFYGYRDNGAIVGAISFTLEEDHLRICRMIVHPDHFRKGIGSQLLSYLCEHHSASRMVVTTGALNLPAINLYRKHGFELVREIEVMPGLSLAWLETRTE